jgi:hypothetical protein
MSAIGARQPISRTGAASRKALDYIKSHDRVWFARGGEMLDAYRAAIRT